jgi:YHS domain-containing protein
MAQRSEPAVQTFLFADLSGFTALTEAHGDEQAADLVARFCVAVRQLLDEHRAHEVKTIGHAHRFGSGARGRLVRHNGQPGGAGVAAASGGEALLTAATRAASGDVEGRMAVDPWHGAGRLTHEGVEYCFCSLGCAGAFAQHPTRYTANDRQ